MAQSASEKGGLLNLSEFDYDLPQERIAQWPLEDRQFREFPELLRGDELIVINNARVLPARLWGHRQGVQAQPIGKNSPIRHEHLTAPVEVLLLRACGEDQWE